MLGLIHHFHSPSLSLFIVFYVHQMPRGSDANVWPDELFYCCQPYHYYDKWGSRLHCVTRVMINWYSISHKLNTTFMIISKHISSNNMNGSYLLWVSSILWLILFCLFCNATLVEDLFMFLSFSFCCQVLLCFSIYITLLSFPFAHLYCEMEIKNLNLIFLTPVRQGEFWECSIVKIIMIT